MQLLAPDVEWTEMAGFALAGFTVRGGLVVRFEKFVDTALARDVLSPDA